MQENHVFEYAVVRIVPKVERQEFLNVGVILYCPKLKFLNCKFTVDDNRLSAFTSKLDVEEVKSHLRAFEQICAGGNDGGPIGKLDNASRFRWLTANRSTIVQTSQVHPGLCADAAQTLDRLHERLVL
jgi:hypothetical protein